MAGGCTAGSQIPSTSTSFGPGRRKGRDSNPGDRSRGLTVFKTAAFNRSATLPRGPQMLGNRSAPVGRLYTGMPVPRRGGRAAEGTRLLSEYGDQTPSRVRIPPSPSRGRRATTAPAIRPVPALRRHDLGATSASLSRRSAVMGARGWVPDPPPQARSVTGIAQREGKAPRRDAEPRRARRR